MAHMSGKCHTAIAAKITVAFVLLLIFIRCNNEESNSPYAEILKQQTFAPLTDSIKHEKNNDGLYFRRAVLLNSNNLPEPALDDFRKAWALKKEEPYSIAICSLLIDKKPDSAILFAREALK